ncbi:hypothetical protein EAY64_05555 [Aquitalea palustris]|uniref:Uncharacterized protein n=1 Tax=Aquitalea palustris TaxID=2480983 RepID=A0A454JKY7_9NEIS|nr:hypothetical protein [Aquitalea palustris]RMD00063.1 hypothetical protein EAY64_05555 [Aquitalea palustris]
MYVDSLLQLSGSITGNTVSGQLVTATGNTLSTNVIDLAGVGTGNTARDIGQGEALEIAIEIMQTLTSSGAATVQFQLVEADDSAISTNVNVIVQTDAYAYTALTAGTLVPLHWDRAAPYQARRYIALRYVIGTAALTNATGQFFAATVKNFQDKGNNTLFNSGFTVA